MLIAQRSARLGVLDGFAMKLARRGVADPYQAMPGGCPPRSRAQRCRDDEMAHAAGLDLREALGIGQRIVGKTVHLSPGYWIALPAIRFQRELVYCTRIAIVDEGETPFADPHHARGVER